MDAVSFPRRTASLQDPTSGLYGGAGSYRTAPVAIPNGDDHATMAGVGRDPIAKRTTAAELLSSARMRESFGRTLLLNADGLLPAAPAPCLSPGRLTRIDFACASEFIELGPRRSRQPTAVHSVTVANRRAPREASSARSAQR